MSSIHYIRGRAYESSAHNHDKRFSSSYPNKWVNPKLECEKEGSGNGTTGKGDADFSGTRGYRYNSCKARASADHHKSASASFVNNISTNKWVRNPEKSSPSSALDSDAAASGCAETESKLSCNMNSDDKIDPNEVLSNNLERRGENMLVTKKDAIETAPKLNWNKQQQQNSGNNADRIDPILNERKKYAHKKMNLYALKHDTEHKRVKMNYPVREPTLIESSFRWVRQTPSSNTTYNENVELRDETEELSFIVNPYENDTRMTNRKRSHIAQLGMANAPRRISLRKSLPERYVASNDSKNGYAEPESNENEIAIKKESAKSSVTSKTLTDFCYIDTGTGGGVSSMNSRSRIFGGRSIRKGNLGLVRVKSLNLTEIAICPTFRRGLPCNNRKCTLRHDVSTEASRPICVFFQRHGMCAKADECPYRHVKVRWDAEICPTFQRLGYCEDPYCVLKHVESRKERGDTVIPQVGASNYK